MTAPGLIAVAMVLAGTLCAAPRWELQYFYDEDRSSMTITDLTFLSATRGVAAATIDERGKEKPVVVVTNDGGARWTVVPVREQPFSLFFLNENLGWMVTHKQLWRTEEAGRSWEKAGKLPEGVLRVHFRDAKNGWAVGLQNGAYFTTDGGKRWHKLRVLEQIKANPDYTAFTSVAFANDRVGMIVGFNQPPRRVDLRRPQLPPWVDPEAAESRAEWPHAVFVLETKDGGSTWTVGTSSLFGRLTRVSLSPGGAGLALIQFREAFAYSSEVFLMNWRNSGSKRVYREKTRSITDVAIPEGGTAYMAGFEVPGTLHSTPIPGKLKILSSRNFADWTEMPVDYRANATRAILASYGDRVWVATDTGMILHLRTEGENKTSRP